MTSEIENPIAISRKSLHLSEVYGKATREIADLKKNHGERWLLLRKDAKTDKECDRMFDSTPEGKREIELSYLMKGLEREMSALKAHLRVLDLFGHL